VSWTAALGGRRIAVTALIAAVAIAVVILSYDVHDNIMFKDIRLSSLVWALRLTVRISLVFFVIAFAARPLNDLFHTRWSRWLRKHRRYVGLAAAAFLLQHLWLLPAIYIQDHRVIGFMLTKGHFFPALVSLSLATLLTLTSFDWAQRALPGWPVLHWIGIQAMWFWYAKAAYGEWTVRKTTMYVVLLGLLGLAMAVRIAARIKESVLAKR
jgi:hypothetical protein